MPECICIMKRTLSKLILLLPFALFVAVIVLNTLDFGGGSIRFIREAVLTVAVWLCFPIIFYQQWRDQQGNHNSLRQIFFLLIFTSLLAFAVARIDSAAFAGVDSIVALFWTLYSISVVLVLFGAFRHLIHIKRRPATARNFKWMLYLQLLFAFLQGTGTQYLKKSPLSWLGTEALLGVMTFILVVLFVTNSFRVSWIHYLNRRQKLACFWGGLLLLPFAWQLFSHFSQNNIVKTFSPFLGVFICYSFLFFAIYCTLALFSLIAHLPTAHLFDRKMKELESLYALSSTLSVEFDLNRLARQIVKLAAEVTESDCCWLELIDPQKQKLDLVAWQNLSENEQAKRRAYSTYEHDIEELTQKQTIVENQVLRNKRLRTISRWKSNLGSVVVVPLRSTQQTIGYLYAGKEATFGFEHEDVELLNAFAAQAVIAVENTKLIESSMLKDRLEHELRLAHDAQMNLLPKEMPKLPGFTIEAVCKTANEVGGDYYDFIPLDRDNRLVVTVGDVSGKGAEAAFYMAEIKGMIGALARTLGEPAKVLKKANRIISKILESNHFITLIYGMIDGKRRCFTFCRAGHCPLLLAEPDRDEIRVIEPRGLGVGLDDGPIFDTKLVEEQIDLCPGQTLLLYTDGATEMRNPAGEEFGEKRLVETFASLKHLPAAQIRDGLLAAIDRFSDKSTVHDDLTFVLIQVIDKSALC